MGSNKSNGRDAVTSRPSPRTTANVKKGQLPMTHPRVAPKTNFRKGISPKATFVPAKSGADLFRSGAPLSACLTKNQEAEWLAEEAKGIEVYLAEEAKANALAVFEGVAGRTHAQAQQCCGQQVGDFLLRVPGPVRRRGNGEGFAFGHGRRFDGKRYSCYEPKALRVT